MYLGPAGRQSNLRWWNLAFIGVPVVAAGFSFAVDDSPIWALLPLALIVIGWLLVGRLSFRIDALGYGFAGAIIILMTVSIAISPNTAILQAIVYPFVWTVTPSLRSAIAANVAVAVAAGTGFLIAFGPSPTGVLTAIAVTVFSFGFSLAFGLWISRIAEWGEERARLLSELTAAQGALEAAHREAGGSSERARIARELHDTLAQSLTGVVMLSQRALATARTADPDLAGLRQQLDVLEEVARGALAETRAVVASEGSVSMDGGLEAALRRLAERFERETGVRVLVSVEAAISRELEVVLLRCAQEALANIRKHASADTATVVVRHGEDDVAMSVEDDGRGIPEDALDRGSGFGLPGMKDRVQLVGGSLQVTRISESGTRLIITIPSRGSSS